MKKLFLLIATAIIFASCSSSDNDNNNPIIHAVALNVSIFSETGAPKWPSQQFCQYVIYKENGEVFKTETLDYSALTNGEAPLYTVKLGADLPEGNYHFAALCAQMRIDPLAIFTPSNFNTDYCSGNRWIATDLGNSSIYFDSFSFAVNSESNKILNVALKPMWSTVKIVVTNADVCPIPQLTTNVTYHLSPRNSGFKIKEKAPTEGDGSFTPNQISTNSLSDLQTSKAINSFYITETENAVIKLEFFEHSISIGHKTRGLKTIYKGKIEMGKNITLTGTLNGYDDESSTYVPFTVTSTGL